MNLFPFSALLHNLHLLFRPSQWPAIFARNTNRQSTPLPNKARIVEQKRRDKRHNMW